MDGGGSKKLKKPQRTCINGMFPKGPPTHGAPLSKHGPPKDTTVPVFQWRASCCLSWEAMMVTTDLPLVNMYLQMEMHLQHSGPDLAADGSISSSSSHHTPPWHRRHLTNGTATLDILTEVVFGCATFNSPMHDNREVVLAVGGYGQATAQVLDYSQPKSQHGQQVITIHLYDCFIWLFCTIAGMHHILPKNYVVFYPASKRLMCAFCNLCESRSF